MKIQDFVAPLVEAFPEPLPSNSEGAEAQLRAFIPLMEKAGCRDAAALLHCFLGTDGQQTIVGRARMEEAGIYSPDMHGFRNVIRGYHPEAFAKAEALSIKAWRELRARLADARDPARLGAIVFLCKCVQACQAVLLLAEYGLELEAAAVLREATEYLFVGSAMARAPEVRERLIRESQREHQKQAQMMLKGDKSEPVISSDDLLKLQALAEGNIKGSGMKVFEAAELASMQSMYHGIYRTMSRIGTHATASTLLHAFVEPNKLHVGPNTTHLHLMLPWVIDCLTLALAHGRQWRTNDELKDAIARGDDQIALWSRLCDLQQEVAAHRGLLVGDDAAKVVLAIDGWLPSVSALLGVPEGGEGGAYASPENITVVLAAGEDVLAKLDHLRETLHPEGAPDASIDVPDNPRQEVTDPAVAANRLRRRQAALLAYLQAAPAAGAQRSEKGSE